MEITVDIGGPGRDTVELVKIKIVARGYVSYAWVTITPEAGGRGDLTLSAQQETRGMSRIKDTRKTIAVKPFIPEQK